MFLFSCDVFFTVHGLNYIPKLFLYLWLDGVFQGFVIGIIVKLSIDFCKVLMTVHNDYLRSFVSCFNNNVGLMNEFG